MTLALDPIDRQILRLLQDDGRMSLSALADAVGLTTTPLRQRVEKLERHGAIRGYHAEIDPGMVERGTMAFVHVTLREHALSRHKKFVQAVTAMPEVLEAYHIAGEEDFVLKVVVENVAAFERFLLEQLTTIPGIARVKSTFVLSTAKAGGPIPIEEASGS